MLRLASLKFLTPTQFATKIKYCGTSLQQVLDIFFYIFDKYLCKTLRIVIRDYSIYSKVSLRYCDSNFNQQPVNTLGAKAKVTFALS